MDFLLTYNNFKSRDFKNRYLNVSSLNKVYNLFSVKIIGYSVNKIPIKVISIGNGNIKILIWSQMHGNETTSTKALIDFIYFLNNNTYLNSCFTFKIIPILNPDGAENYSRFNANKIDLNRDAKKQSQPESKALIELYNNFKPDFCYNLHDQKTLYNINNLPSVTTFLSPSINKEKIINSIRKKSMGVIGYIYKNLKNHIPGKIGLYNDNFNLNCFGDYLQFLGTPTILFETGQDKNNYSREESRKWLSFSLYLSSICISNNCYDFESYKQIPIQNNLYCDLLLRNIKIEELVQDIIIEYNEVLHNNKVIFVPIIRNIGFFDKIFAHKTIILDKNIKNVKIKISIGDDATKLLKYFNISINL